MLLRFSKKDINSLLAFNKWMQNVKIQLHIFLIGTNIVSFEYFIIFFIYLMYARFYLSVGSVVKYTSPR